MKCIYKLISTWWLYGTIKYIPGTMGSIAAFPIVPIIISNKILGYIIIIFLFIIGLWSTTYYIKYYHTGSDPQEIVIDEVVGQLFTVFLVSIILNQDRLSYSILLLCFLSFRFFDIIKPWPISIIDKETRYPICIMLDDILAGCFACLVTVILYYLV
ncbi:phosphatidylglycerophosphatase A family protein [Wolbachia endosymbiont of Howardula sp.]|uniref:phosphatidylglycerophosphatase A family protein n=1 Tax=Wolbachia endosymbiont of Howardula sp. TaxID=2916816 RepID=UPI00217EF898|nr:phosphatidylglycerophosphatase A [Wolbachia endosymbiont of Howardula sp.]UWI82952.1 phosphatidylglycerophosphatase A [Wolbachia endosymbiont of Howardula sp.]